MMSIQKHCIKHRIRLPLTPRIEDLAFDQETLTHLTTFLPLFDAQKVSLKVALANQTTATKAKDEAFDVVAIFISHFIQSFNMGIVRKMFLVNEQAILVR